MHHISPPLPGCIIDEVKREKKKVKRDLVRKQGIGRLSLTNGELSTMEEHVRPSALIIGGETATHLSLHTDRLHCIVLVTVGV